MLARDVSEVANRFTTGIDPLLPRSAAAAYRMANWVNQRVVPANLVLVMPEQSWLIHCHTADILQAVAISGIGTSFYPNGLPRDRFVYDTSLDAGKFLVVDDFTRKWIQENPHERRIVDEARLRWPIVYKAGEYTIYGNPQFGAGQKRGTPNQG
jgi:hypothetical protein